MTIVIDTSGQQFDPETPPDFNAGVRATMSAKEAAAVIGTTAVVADVAEREHAARVAATEASKAAQVADGGGVEIVAELRGEVGAAVAGVLALDTIDSAARKVRARIDTEQADLLERMRETAQREHLDGLLSEAWDAAGAKQRVPEVMAAHLHWSAHERPRGNPEFLAIECRERINTEQATRRQQRVRDRLADLDAVLVAEAVGVLETAGRAADLLTEAGLSVSATAEDVLSAKDLGVAEAWQHWSESTARWSEIQSARRWVAVATVHGFSKRHPGELIAADTRDTEADMWRTQWVGVAMSAHVVGAAAALGWWLHNGRPTPAGVTVTEDGGVR
ncbi:hypothetical protein ACFV24_09465 [Nocardia fluminea]|uniref:hypothetical protein n=1 Tax=Nocardia fluminea TaxID=134984 RepID=UPI00366BBDC5